MELTDLPAAAAAEGDYSNTCVGTVNDQVVRLSVMEKPFHWHAHPNSDELFLVLEGWLLVELPGEAHTLGPGQMLTIRAGVPHCTRPIRGRSVNITVEHRDLLTVPASPLDVRHD